MQVIFDRYLDADNAKGMHNVNRDFKEGFEYGEIRLLNFDISKKQKLINEIKGKCNGF